MAPIVPWVRKLLLPLNPIMMTSHSTLDFVLLSFCIVHARTATETTFLQDAKPWYRNDRRGQGHTSQQAPEMTLPHNPILQDPHRLILYRDILRIDPLQQRFLLVSFHPRFMIKGVAGAEGIHGHPSLAANAAVAHAVHVIR